VQFKEVAWLKRALDNASTRESAVAPDRLTVGWRDLFTANPV
jgi:hypothetical protein